MCQPCFLRATSDLQLETFFPCLAAPLRTSPGTAAYLIVLFSKALGGPGQSQPTSLPQEPLDSSVFPSWPPLLHTPAGWFLTLSWPVDSSQRQGRGSGVALAPENPGPQTSPLRNLKFCLRNSLLGLPNSSVVSRVSSRPYLSHPVAPTITINGFS